ncbi:MULTISPECIES: hypothetical protein [Streptomyces]|uniref:Uncharacterized protein n=1 Tax=Streptomyces tsukubensis (strain DSM 42081 / NBRC 108919 / NRRL 18488 / 9993) TaxID=1114943 RepID=I2N194_STRT9|nr:MULTISPECIES: hypothetical protein [Streptomyces]AZK94963.1 hypothetical protein B7R87_14615 [Streptomyces tsukubensis]EIF90791.1 hypothetical protein [Streptomyces tsukubensis NRRL18488]MYS64800.1 hypothetical protein [Streptomyces sp. SID5473]QKM68964.1 hypothetical protein STSU_019155 [Streptomyces tsukubensis NRRL18488]TAI40821.1 hypothetical protein EWI31_31085 [Streptomyces tsukubensis]
MTAQDEEAPPVEDLVCCVELGPGWVDLTLATGARTEAEALARRTVELYGPRGLRIDEKALFDDVADRAAALNAEAPVMAAAFYSGTGEAVADFVIDTYLDTWSEPAAADAEDREGPARPGLDEARALLLDRSAPGTAAGPDVTYPDLPAGPAVRVGSQVRTRQLLGLWRQDTGSLTYAVLPPGVRSLVLASFTWRNMAQTEKVTRLADELMATLRVVPEPEDGTGEGGGEPEECGSP